MQVGSHIFSAATICKKFKRAAIEQQTSEDYYNGVTSASPPEMLPQWKDEIEYAEAHRQDDVTHMDMMQSKVLKRECNSLDGHVHTYKPIKSLVAS